MSYQPLKQLDPNPDDRDTGSEAEMESGKNWKAESDQMLSFFRHRRSRVAHTRWAHVSGGRCENNCLGVTLRLIPWIINLILAVSMVSMVWKFDSELNASHLPPKDLLYTLAGDAIEYRIETTYASEDYPDSEYQGWPTDEKDRLWNQYEKGNYLWIDRQTADKLPFKTERAPSEEHMNDYVVGLSVFHVLHCLSVLRRGIYPHRYNSSMIKPDGSVDYHKWHHVDHCLETVRRDILCHADTSATTWEWIEGSQMSIRAETLHVCRNFDIISEWAYDRHVESNQRTHIEKGQVVDYSGQPPSAEWDNIQVQPPVDWTYREEDM